MNTSNYLNIAENYYEYMLAKDFNSMAECLHPAVDFVSPLAQMKGRKEVAEAAENLGKILQNIEIRSRFTAGDQIMFAYDFFFPKPIGKLRSAVLMDFQDGLISKIELFFDGRPFGERKS